MSNIKDVIIGTADEEGPGKGLTGNELFTKDELGIIIDLEDEATRTG